MPIITPHTDLLPQPFWRRLLDRIFGRFTLRRYKLYMIKPDSDLTDRVGCDDEVVEVERLTTSQVSIELIYNELLQLHERQYNSQLINALWQSDLTLIHAYVDGDDVAHIELEGDLVATEACSAPRIIAQLEKPALQVRSGTGFVRRAEVTVNGQALRDILA